MLFSAVLCSLSIGLSGCVLDLGGMISNPFTKRPDTETSAPESERETKAPTTVTIPNTSEIQIIPGPVKPRAEDLLMKPVIYVYSDKETDVDIKLSVNNHAELTCVYPKPVQEENTFIWKVKTVPDRDRLVLRENNSDRAYNYVYWEGANLPGTINSGKVVKGEESAAYLEDSLGKLGLSDAEANEFIVYWLPELEKNRYNLISFDNTYLADFPLSASTADGEIQKILRVYMVFKAVENPEDYKSLPEEQFDSRFSRNGLYVVEWGGSEIH